jgi:hypothetical protein
MIKLDAGNVLLKPSHRRQLMTGLRRSLRLGNRLGDFVLTITMRRRGRVYDVRASVIDACGSFNCHTRRYDWRTAVRDLARSLATRLHRQCLQRGALA